MALDLTLKNLAPGTSQQYLQCCTRSSRASGASYELAQTVPQQPQLEAAIPGFRPVFTSDNFLVHVAAAEEGVGAVVLARGTHRLMPKRDLVPLKVDLGLWALHRAPGVREERPRHSPGTDRGSPAGAELRPLTVKKRSS